MKNFVIAVDFDGTCVTHDYPEIGKDIGAVPVLRRLVEKGYKLILYTMRSDELLQKAEEWFNENEIPLWGSNINKTQILWTKSRKVYANLYIDDACLGIPLKVNPSLSSRPYVDWEKVERLLEDRGVL